MRVFMSCILLLVGIMGGACSSLEVARLKQGSPPEGVPYQLTRLNFVIKVEPPTGTGANPTYTLNQVTMPDPDQRFWVNAKPAFLTKTSLMLTLGQNGELSNTTTTADEQVVPTIKVIGEFAATALGVAAKVAAAADQTDRLKGFERSIRKEECPAAGQAGKDEPKCEMIRRMTKLYERSPQDLAERFYPKSTAERDWLVAASSEVAGKVKVATPAYSQAITACTNDSVCKAAFDKVPDTQMVDSTKKLGELIETSANESTPESLDRILEGLKEKIRKLDGAKPEDIKPLELEKQIVLAAKIMRDSRMSYKSQQQMFDRLGGLSNGEMRHRRALDLEEQILEEEQRLIQNNDAKESEALKKLHNELALVINGLAETMRANTLRDLLRKLGTASDQIIAQDKRGVGLMEEYQRARQELETVLGVLKVKRDALRPDKSSSQLVSREVTSRPEWWRDGKRSTAAELRTKLLLTPELTQLPEFVIVIERGVMP